MLLVMSTAGIFDEEECTLTAGSQSDNRKTPARPESDIHKYSALWQVTWERIDCFLPNLRQELFTPRSQLPVSNIPKMKPEQEKTVSEESNRAMELPSNGEKLCCYVTNRFQVALRLYSNRSQMTSKCCKNKKVAHEAQPSVSLMFLPHFDVLCDLLLNRRTATWNLFVLYN